jgi:Cholesterol oxidase, substrate-binding/FAD binding domain
VINKTTHQNKIMALQQSNNLVGFPKTIPVSRIPYSNWDGTIKATSVWTCNPSSADDVVAACNWAAQNGYTVRPKGIAHNWSPLTIASGQSNYNNILLINMSFQATDFKKSLRNIQFIPATAMTGPAVKVGTGATMGELLEFLEQQPGGKGAASGFSFPHIPAPDHLTVGGVLAINGHGTAIPTSPNDNFPTTYGSMSNRILSLTAVVTDPTNANPNEYQLKTFLRGDHETTAFLTQLGRALIVEVTLQVIDNYNLRCQSITDIDKSVLFAPQSGNTVPVNSCMDFLQKSGRIEIIWFPFTDNPWLKVWTVEPTQPAGTKLVNSPNNYPFSDNLPDWVTDMIKTILDIPSITKLFGPAMEKITNLGLDASDARDLWGPSKNTLFYVKDTTLRVTANGYAVLMNQSNIQNAIAAFTAKFDELLNKYANTTDGINNPKYWLGEYPVNSPLEIRITGLDKPNQVPSMTGGPVGRPVISSLSTDAETDKNNWDVALWLDVLTLPGTGFANEFYTELEAWMLWEYTSPKAKLVPEWSKGWAFTDNGGAWSSSPFLENIRQGFTQNRATNDNWAWVISTLGKYDAKNLFQSPLTKTLFVPAK